MLSRATAPAGKEVRPKMPLSHPERDTRSAVLAACHRVGLYGHLKNSRSAEFLDRPCTELVEAAEETCPIGPPYNIVLHTFRETMRAELACRGHSGFMIFLQRLCTKGFSWRDFCEYHADRL